MKTAVPFHSTAHGGGPTDKKTRDIAPSIITSARALYVTKNETFLAKPLLPHTTM